MIEENLQKVTNTAKSNIPDADKFLAIQGLMLNGDYEIRGLKHIVVDFLVSGESMDIERGLKRKKSRFYQPINVEDLRNTP
jgi:hypothetical protein